MDGDRRSTNRKSPTENRMVKWSTVSHDANISKTAGDTICCDAVRSTIPATAWLFVNFLFIQFSVSLSLFLFWYYFTTNLVLVHYLVQVLRGRSCLRWCTVDSDCRQIFRHKGFSYRAQATTTINQYCFNTVFVSVSNLVYVNMWHNIHPTHCYSYFNLLLSLLFVFVNYSIVNRMSTWLCHRNQDHISRPRRDDNNTATLSIHAVHGHTHREFYRYYAFVILSLK